MTVERNFYRCQHCCYVFAIDGEMVSKTCGIGSTSYKMPVLPYCDCGGGKWAAEGRSSVEWMGKVQGNFILKVEDRCPCDSRCTHAMGPKCDCVCNGVNHGTRARVKVVTNVQGVPQIIGVDLQDRLIAVAEFNEACAEAQKVIDADPGVIAIRKREWIKDRTEWMRANDLLNSLHRVRKLKTMPGRMKALAKIMASAKVAA